MMQIDDPTSIRIGEIMSRRKKPGRYFKPPFTAVMAKELKQIDYGIAIALCRLKAGDTYQAALAYCYNKHKIQIARSTLYNAKKQFKSGFFEGDQDLRSYSGVITRNFGPDPDGKYHNYDIIYTAECSREMRKIPSKYAADITCSEVWAEVCGFQPCRYKIYLDLGFCAYEIDYGTFMGGIAELQAELRKISLTDFCVSVGSDLMNIYEQGGFLAIYNFLGCIEETEKDWDGAGRLVNSFRTHELPDSRHKELIMERLAKLVG